MRKFELMDYGNPVPFDEEGNILRKPQDRIVAYADKETGELIHAGVDFDLVNWNGWWIEFPTIRTFNIAQASVPITQPFHWEDSYPFSDALQVHHRAKHDDGEYVILANGKGRLFPMFVEIYDRLCSLGCIDGQGKIFAKFGVARSDDNHFSLYRRGSP